MATQPFNSFLAMYTPFSGSANSLVLHAADTAYKVSTLFAGQADFATAVLVTASPNNTITKFWFNFDDTYIGTPPGAAMAGFQAIDCTTAQLIAINADQWNSLIIIPAFGQVGDQNWNLQFFTGNP